MKAHRQPSGDQATDAASIKTLIASERQRVLFVEGFRAFDIDFDQVELFNARIVHQPVQRFHRQFHTPLFRNPVVGDQTAEGVVTAQDKFDVSLPVAEGQIKNLTPRTEPVPFDIPAQQRSGFGICFDGNQPEITSRLQPPDRVKSGIRASIDDHGIFDAADAIHAEPGIAFLVFTTQEDTPSRQRIKPVFDLQTGKFFGHTTRFIESIAE
jgi:hypothetical protein